MIHPQLTLNCRGRLLSLEQPVVMGILNLTPDSFFSGSRVQAGDHLLFQAEKMLNEGATILDLGGMSSRPGARIIDETEELQRVIPAVSSMARAFPEAILSVDTIRAKVALESYGAGAAMINDISAGRFDKDMHRTAAQCKVPYVLMHMQGKPADMQENPQYEDVVVDVLDFFIRKLEKLRQAGVTDVIIDPGFGFGKTVRHNYELMAKLHVFKILELPILAGVSRKSMITRLLNVKPEDALNGTTALHLAALQQGSSILRVHDVKEAIEVIRIWQELENF